ncbi:hypothetical protein MHYP_G00151530 [Metynnis hypsauchen]
MFARLHTHKQEGTDKSVSVSAPSRSDKTLVTLQAEALPAAQEPASAVQRHSNPGVAYSTCPQTLASIHRWKEGTAKGKRTGEGQTQCSRGLAEAANASVALSNAPAGDLWP